MRQIEKARAQLQGGEDAGSPDRRRVPPGIFGIVIPSPIKRMRSPFLVLLVTSVSLAGSLPVKAQQRAAVGGELVGVVGA